MQDDGIYDEFISVTQVRLKHHTRIPLNLEKDAFEFQVQSDADCMSQREYSAVFQTLKGEEIDLCLPSLKVPDEGLVDYTDCN